jgi:AbiV family abortive infection protein
MSKPSKLKIGFRKLAELEFQCYQNGLRLHFDSVLLFKKHSFPSAFALSVIACEELGKGFAIAEMTFQARINRGFHGGEQQYLNELLLNHKIKQGWFVSHTARGMSALRRLWKKQLTMQKEKNNALYVGLRNNHQIVRPFLLSKSKALNQVRLVNDELIHMIEGTRNGTYLFEEVLDAFLRKRGHLRKLKSASAVLR